MEQSLTLLTSNKSEPSFKIKKCNRCNRKRMYLNEFNECELCESRDKCKRCNNQRDYLSGFQVCNSCCKRIEQMTPNGFKPNLRFVYCRRCNKQSDYLNIFQICDPCCKQMEQTTPNGFKPNLKLEKCEWCYQIKDCLNEFQVCKFCEEIKISGNKVIDDFIKCTLNDQVIRRMEFIPYDKLKGVEFIAEGGFSKIYSATWIDGPIVKWSEGTNEYVRNCKMKVALKELKDSKNANSEELNELKIYCDLILGKNDNYISRCYGITQEPTTQNFMIVTKYYDLGDLTHYITKNFFNVDWLNKLDKLHDIIIGLRNLHKQDIIHRDYHSGNIFIASHHDNFARNIAITGDLGLSKSAINNDNNEIYGIIPYISPEIFQWRKYNKASDIYSFGMIMWELMTGRKPFWNRNHDTELIINLCDGLRPPIISGSAPKGYVELMQECWDPDPNKRPTANDIFIKILDIRSNEYDNPTKIIASSDIGPTEVKYSGAVYTSRPLSVMMKSAELTRSFRISKPDKRKFDDPIENSNYDKTMKKIKRDANHDCLTKETSLNDDINSRKYIDYDYTTKELGFDI